MNEPITQAAEPETLPSGAEPAEATEPQAAAAPTVEPAAFAGRSFTQSEVDQIVTKALRTREENLTREFEERFAAERRAADEAQLAETGQWRELAERHQAELDRLRAENERRALEAETADVLARKGLPSLGRVFDLDLASIEGRTAAAEILAAVVADGVEARVGQRLELPAPARGAVALPPADLDSQIREAERKGDWARSLVLKDRKIRQLRDRTQAGS